MKRNAEKTVNTKVKHGFIALFSMIVAPFVSKKRPIIRSLAAMSLLSLFFRSLNQAGGWEPKNKKAAFRRPSLIHFVEQYRDLEAQVAEQRDDFMKAFHYYSCIAQLICDLAHKKESTPGFRTDQHLCDITHT
ncbi:hypothetical protein ACI2I2_21910 [Scandinavium sp. NPDC088450]|uniref:hypothetical protein n=1 Tax=Scandinavium sp. NPDC088450 TaxID=3364514 RepID=UPI00384A9B8A